LKVGFLLSAFIEAKGSSLDWVFFRDKKVERFLNALQLDESEAAEL
jgi:hypothetical protein